jgi:hypothetical protein
MVFSCTEICTTSTNEHRTSQKKKNYLVTHKCVQLHTDHSNPKHKKKEKHLPTKRPYQKKKINAKLSMPTHFLNKCLKNISSSAHEIKIVGWNSIRPCECALITTHNRKQT